MGKEAHREVRSVEEEISKFVADAAGANILPNKRLVAGLLEMPAVRAGKRAIFDQLHLCGRVPHPEPALGRRGDGARPVALPAMFSRQQAARLMIIAAAAIAATADFT